MSKALWFVVRDIPHRSPDVSHGDYFPPLSEVKEKLHAKILEIASEPLRQGNTAFSGPNPWVSSGAADPEKLRIVEVAWKKP